MGLHQGRVLSQCSWSCGSCVLALPDFAASPGLELKHSRGLGINASGNGLASSCSLPIARYPGLLVQVHIKGRESLRKYVIKKQIMHHKLGIVSVCLACRAIYG